MSKTVLFFAFLGLTFTPMEKLTPPPARKSRVAREARNMGILFSSVFGSLFGNKEATAEADLPNGTYTKSKNKSPEERVKEPSRVTFIHLPPPKKTLLLGQLAHQLVRWGSSSLVWTMRERRPSCTGSRLMRPQRPWVAPAWYSQVFLGGSLPGCADHPHHRLQRRDGAQLSHFTRSWDVWDRNHQQHTQHNTGGEEQQIAYRLIYK